MPKKLAIFGKLPMKNKSRHEPLFKSLISSQGPSQVRHNLIYHNMNMEVMCTSDDLAPINKPALQISSLSLL